MERFCLILIEKIVFNIQIHLPVDQCKLRTEAIITNILVSLTSRDMIASHTSSDAPIKASFVNMSYHFAIHI